MRLPLQPLQQLQKTQLQPPFGPSVDSLFHPWLTTTNLSYRFPIFETSATALCGTTGIRFIKHVWMEWERTAAGVLQRIKRCGGRDLALFLSCPLLPSHLDCSSVVVLQSGGPWEVGCGISRSSGGVLHLLHSPDDVKTPRKTKQYQTSLLSSQPGEWSQRIPPK